MTKENVEDYGLYENRFTAEVARTEVTEVDDEEAGRRAWRVNELIGDYVYLEGGAEYGYVDDLLFNDKGNLQAVVARPDLGYGAGGYHAYPYYGYGYGWDPGYDYYEMPYTADEVADLEPFDYGELDRGAF